MSVQKLETVEAARGLAALAVVLFHANAAARHIGARAYESFSLGEHGVDFFFVLSGFIIFFVHARDIGRPAQARSYALKRFIRLFPLLWLIAIGWMALKTLVGEPPAIEAIGTSLLLYPSLVEPVPIVVWTLRHEVLFYLAFLVLILNRKAGFILFAVWTSGALVQLFLSVTGQPIDGLGSFFLSSFQLDFMMGAGIALLHGRRSFKPSFYPLVISLLGVAVLFFIEERLDIARDNLLDYTSMGATVWTAILGIAFAGVLHGLLRAEALIRVPRLLILLGGASYAIYLVHSPLTSLAQRVAALMPAELLSLGGAHVFITLVGVAAGVIVHLFFEKPVAKYLRRRAGLSGSPAVAPLGGIPGER